MKKFKTIGIGVISSLLTLCVVGVIYMYLGNNKTSNKLMGNWRVVESGAVDSNNKSDGLYTNLYTMLFPKNSEIQINKDKIVLHGQAVDYRIEDEKLIITSKDKSETYVDAYFDKENLVFKIGNFAAVMEKSDGTNKVSNNTDTVSEDKKTQENKSEVKENTEAPKAVSKNESIKVDSTSSVFNNKINFTVQDYSIDGSNVTVHLKVVSNYDKEINLWPNGMYLMNNNGTRFSMDMSKHLSKGENEFLVVKGESKTFELYFKDYENSGELNLHVDKIWCMDPALAMKEKINIKLI